MDVQKKKGALEVTGTYICWGLLSLFWNLLSEVNSVYILAQRVIWSMLLMCAYLAARGRLGELRGLRKDQKTIGVCLTSGVLICINWGVYIYAINSGHVLDASLGYFLEPILAAVIGVLVFREKMSRLEQVTVVFSVIGVAYLILAYRMIPVMALVIGLSFAVYGAVKKRLTLSAEASLFLETLLVTPFALLFCIYCELQGKGSIGVLSGAQFLLLPMAGVVTSIPLLLFNLGVRQIPYYLTGILMYINPTLQFLMGLFYFREPLDVPRLIAFGFIWVGVGFTICQNVREMKPGKAGE